MDAPRLPSWALRLLSVVAFVTVGPGVVSAHDVAASRFRAPLPLWMVFVGAAATVAVTALWLAFTKQTAVSTARKRAVLSVPSSVARPVRQGARTVFFAAFSVVLVAGVVGPQIAAENVATVFTWPVWFRGLALVAVLVGTPWGVLSPWRTLYDTLVGLEGRVFALLGEYPSALGEWPAVVGFVALIGIVENLTVIPQSPRLTAVLLGGYALAMVGGAVLYGPVWLRRADPLGTLYRLFGRVAAVDISTDTDGGYTVTLRRPWDGCLAPVGSVPLVVFVVTTVYTVSFDGFTNTRLFQTVLFGLRGALGTGSGTSMLLYVAGLAGFVATFGLGSWFVERLGTGDGRGWIAAARWFAPTVLPIAAAYEVAHNYPYVIRNLGQLVVVSTRWIGHGVDAVSLLGWLSLPVFWGSQVALIVSGHVIAVVAAHYVAVRRFDSRSAVRRGHLPLVALMVGYTVLSLWIISQPVVAG